MKTIKKSGEWELRAFKVTKADEAWQMKRSSYTELGRYVPAGLYLQLVRENTVVMSNTPDELKDFGHFIEECITLSEQKNDGINVLIAGLGMGCMADALLKNDFRGNITVIEKSLDVINITAHKYKNCNNVAIIQDDIFELNIRSLPAVHYDIAWFDIWDDINADNIEEFRKLRRKYSKKVKNKDVLGRT